MCVVVDCDSDVQAFCEAVLRGEEPESCLRPVTYEVEHRRYPDLDSWIRELVRDRAEDKLAEVRVTGDARVPILF